ncbi:glucosaminidase domain-containing protein [Neobacillus novalis]|uniref:Glucosaminidase domain-containing protein n=2 Tax=Neobacillus novalis TaxID=220687 RepID=A0AA95SAQ9_9BACI|nr:glucosaminidase domain-containing protein [Neobacillus novalis]WHY88395.1 glucosaminidase domain-containing protein [Neobacillus novalis]
MNINSLLTEQLLNKTISNYGQTAIAAKTTSSSFSSLLSQVILEAELAKIDGGNSESIADYFKMNPINLGINPNSINTDSVVELLSTLVGGTPVQYENVDSAALDSQLKGALKNKGNTFVEAGKMYQISPALLAAISIHETGNGSSNAANYKHNVAGMMGKNGLKTYASVEDSIFDMARNLRKNYLDDGKMTIAQIGAKYAPIGADNDPNQLNNDWVSGVQHYFEKLTKADFA